MKKEQYFMSWREDFDNQEGWFSSLQDLKKEIKRIKELEKNDDGEATIFIIIKGTEVTDQLLTK